MAKADLQFTCTDYVFQKNLVGWVVQWHSHSPHSISFFFYSEETSSQTHKSRPENEVHTLKHQNKNDRGVHCTTAATDDDSIDYFLISCLVNKNVQIKWKLPWAPVMSLDVLICQPKKKKKAANLHIKRLESKNGLINGWPDCQHCFYWVGAPQTVCRADHGMWGLQ